MSGTDDFERLLEDSLSAPDLELDPAMRRRLLAAAAEPLPQGDNIIPFEPPARREAFDWLVGESPATPSLIERLMSQPAFLTAVEEERRFLRQLRRATRARQSQSQSAATSLPRRRRPAIALAGSALAASIALLAGALWQAVAPPEIPGVALTADSPPPTAPAGLAALPPAPALRDDPAPSPAPIATGDAALPEDPGPWVDSRESPASIAASGRSVAAAISPDFFTPSPEAIALASASSATLFPEEETTQLAQGGALENAGGHWDFRSSLSDSECLNPGNGYGNGPDDIDVPEPAASGLFLIGFALAALRRRRRP